MERKYVITKLREGDYLLPSNDAQTIWRLASHTEEGTGEYRDKRGKWRPVTGTWWSAYYMRASKFSALVDSPTLTEDDILGWDEWETWAWGAYRTRAAAIADLPEAP